MQNLLGMYRTAIFKIQPELESTGYQTNYPAGTRYLQFTETVTINSNSVWIKNQKYN